VPCPRLVLCSSPLQLLALSRLCLALLSIPASCPVSLLSTTLPCPSYSTCSFHSAVGYVHPDCRVLLSTPSTSVSHSRLHLCHVSVMPRVLLALFSQTGSCALTCPDRQTGSVHRPAGSALCRSPGEMTAGRAQWGGSWNESATQWEQGMSN